MEKKREIVSWESTSLEILAPAINVMCSKYWHFEKSCLTGPSEISASPNKLTFDKKSNPLYKKKEIRKIKI